MTGSFARSDLPWCLLIALGFVAMWAVMGPLGPFPVNDDWAYTYAVRAILAHGRFELTGFSAPNLYLQAWWGALFCLPFGLSHQALQVSTLVAGLAGLCAAFGLMRELAAPRAVAAAAALTLAANPLFLANAGTFMTDVPFVSCCTASLWLYARAARRRPELVPVGAHAMALAALFVRQFALALPIAFAAGSLVRRRFGWRMAVEALLPIVVFVAAHVAFQRWIVASGRAPLFAESLGELSPARVLAALDDMHFEILSMLPYLGAFVFPFAAILLAGSIRRRAVWATALAGALAGLAALQLGYRIGLMENGFGPFGLGPVTLPDVFIQNRNVPQGGLAQGMWAAVTVLGGVGGAALAWAVARSAVATLAALRGRRLAALWPQVVLLSFTVAILAAILAASALASIFDRYLLVLIIPLCALVWLAAARLAAPPRPVLLGAVPLAACAVVAVVTAHDFFSFQRVRWAAAAWLADRGATPEEIDGGYEINARLFRLGFPDSTGKSWWWVVDDRYMIAAGPVPGYREIAQRTVPRWLPGPAMRLAVLRRDGP